MVKVKRKSLIKELKSKNEARKQKIDVICEPVKDVNIVAAVRARIEVLADKEKLLLLDSGLQTEYKDVFDPLPHYLLMDVYCKVNLKDASKTITTRSYSCPRKYRDAWKTLIQQHLDAGRICPSLSEYASPAFIVPKSDPQVLPRWVNDYRQINSNTITDSYPLPWVEDILADAGRGKIWSKMDMTNSFFSHTYASGQYRFDCNNDAVWSV
jgi:hypothetical protein